MSGLDALVKETERTGAACNNLKDEHNLEQIKVRFRKFYKRQLED